MKKIWIIVLLVIGMIACTEQNTPDTPETTDTESPGDTIITTVDTIAIVWNGANATVTGSHDSVSVTSSNGYVTVNSTVKDISYLLSGSGRGQLTIYGTNRHQLILKDLTLACSDGPVINNQCKKSCFVELQGANSLTDGSSYVSSSEDRKGTFFSEGQIILSGGGSLTIKANYKNGLCSDDYIRFAESTGALNITAVNKGIEANDGIYFEGGTFVINAGSEGIESDSVLVISGGEIFVQASDDAINSGDNMTISGGLVMAYSTGNDGIDANGNCYITGGTVYAIGANSPEVAIDANSEEQKKLYVQGGTLVAIGGLESGASLSQTCYAASSVSKNTWYALYDDSEVAFVFKTPSNLSSSTLVVSTSGTASLKSGVSTSGGSSIFNSYALTNATVSGGSSVTLSTYTGGNSGGGPGGGGPGGRPGGW
jgi:hypothetical protein